MVFCRNLWEKIPMSEDPFITGLRDYFSANPTLKPATVSADAGLDKSTIRMMFEGRTRSPKVSTCVSIARALGTSVEAILTGGAERVEVGAPAPDGKDLVEVLDINASAGFGSVVEAENHVYNLAFDRDFLRSMTTAPEKKLKIIKVKGHSMEPTLVDDDQVLVDTTKTNLSFDGLFVLRFDDALHVKRIGRSVTAGNVMVISDHPAYPPLDMPKSEIATIGRVLWYGRKV